MSVGGVVRVCQKLTSLTLHSRPALLTPALSSLSQQQARWFNYHRVDMPKPGEVRMNLRAKVHYPEDGKYTVMPLKMTKLAGRDPETGRIISGCLGGGAKRRYRWIDWFRTGPTDGTFLEERVIGIYYDPNRTARIALVAAGDHLRYLLATENMKAGDLIRTSSYIPRMPVRPKEGDAYPVGALPTSTLVNCVEVMPGDGARFVKAAGMAGLVLKKGKDKVIIQLPSKRQIAIDPQCMATVGKIYSEHSRKPHIGSAQRLRWLGWRPVSGLWQRKTGYHGRKIRPLPPVKSYQDRKERPPLIKFTLNGEGPTKTIIPSTDRVT